MSGAGEEDKKPGDQSAHINLKVKGQENKMYTLIVALKLNFCWCEKDVLHGVLGLPLFHPKIGIRIGMDKSVCRCMDGNEVFFRIKRSTQMRKLMNAYCDRQSVDFNAIAFLFDGRRLRAEQTPDELEMEDGDEIDAMLHQTGGGPENA